MDRYWILGLIVIAVGALLAVRRLWGRRAPEAEDPWSRTTDDAATHSRFANSSRPLDLELDPLASGDEDTAPAVLSAPEISPPEWMPPRKNARR